jgi:molybdate transport system substrate-binding protein
VPATRIRKAAATAAAASIGLIAAGCSSSSSPAADPSNVRATATAANRLSGTITVFAAASLKAAFTTLGVRFEAAHPGVSVKFDFAGSDSLAAQITEGAPADVFAAANQTTMNTAARAGYSLGTPTVFAANELEIAVAAGDPLGIKTLADLAKPGVKVALCAPSVPCGAAAQSALKATGVGLTPVTQEQDVTSTLTKLELGEVDAALVYRTDVATAGGKVTGVNFPSASAAVNSYPITVVKGAANPAAARAFVAYVLSPAGEDILQKAGFIKP